MEIKELLNMSDVEKERRVQEILMNVPTFQGIKFLETKLKVYDVQPFPFIVYLARWTPEKLEDLLDRYDGYDGAENSSVIIDMLKEKCCIFEALQRLELKYKKG